MCIIQTAKRFSSNLLFNLFFDLQLLSSAELGQDVVQDLELLLREYELQAFPDSDHHHQLRSKLVLTFSIPANLSTTCLLKD